MTEDDAQRFARRQLADYDSHSPGTIFADDSIFLTIQDAYRVQIETAGLRSARGEAVAGYKIGCVSEIVRRQLGVEHPVFGHVFRSEIRPSGVRLPSGDFANLAIEGEFAVTLASDVPDPGALRESPRDYVAEVFPVIELHNQVRRGPKPSAVELIANNAIHAGVIVPEIRATAGIGLPLEISVAINGERRGVIATDPFATLHPLAMLLQSFGIKLRRGDIVLTGSPLPLYPASAGDSIRVHCPTISDVTVIVG